MNSQAPIANRLVMNGKPVFSVAAKSVINFDSGFKHKLLCDGPTFSAGTACAFSCAYCYVPDMVRKLRGLPSMAGVVGNHEEIVIRRENALQVMQKQIGSAEGRRLAGKRLVIYGSPLVDVAGNMELVRETVSLVWEILRVTKWDVRLLSKSPLIKEVAMGLDGKYGATAQGRVIYGVSTGTLDDGLGRCIEQGTGLVSKRIAALHWLQDNGYRTFGMVCPSLPQEDYGRFATEMAAAIRAERCEHVWAEVMNVRGESLVRTLAALRRGGYDLQADTLEGTMQYKGCWEEYARTTFWGHVGALPAGKLRFLQYVTGASREWWEARRGEGAVVL